MPAGDSAATASSHKQAAQLEGSQTAQNSKQAADTLTTNPGLQSTKVGRGINVTTLKHLVRYGRPDSLPVCHTGVWMRCAAKRDFLRC